MRRAFLAALAAVGFVVGLAIPANAVTGYWGSTKTCSTPYVSVQPHIVVDGTLKRTDGFSVYENTSGWTIHVYETELLNGTPVGQTWDTAYTHADGQAIRTGAGTNYFPWERVGSGTIAARFLIDIQYTSSPDAYCRQDIVI